MLVYLNDTKPLSSLSNYLEFRITLKAYGHSLSQYMKDFLKYA